MQEVISCLLSQINNKKACFYIRGGPTLLDEVLASSFCIDSRVFQRQRRFFEFREYRNALMSIQVTQVFEPL